MLQQNWKNLCATPKTRCSQINKFWEKSYGCKEAYGWVHIRLLTQVMWVRHGYMDEKKKKNGRMVNKEKGQKRLHLKKEDIPSLSVQLWGQKKAKRMN